MAEVAMPNGSYVCECCKLERPIQRPVSSNIENRMHQANRPPRRCAPCAPHREVIGWEAAAAVNYDPAQWYWELAQQKDSAARHARAELEQVRVRSDARITESHEKMIAAFRSRDSYIRQLARIAKHHEPTGRGCSCRRRDCETLQIVEQPWVRRRINEVDYQDGYGEYDAEAEPA